MPPVTPRQCSVFIAILLTKLQRLAKKKKSERFTFKNNMVIENLARSLWNELYTSWSLFVNLSKIVRLEKE